MEPFSSFGAWLKHRRHMLDLTQERLAHLVGCSVELISKIETNARRPSRQMAELLATHLEIPPEAQAAFVRTARGLLGADHALTEVLPIRPLAAPAPEHRAGRLTPPLERPGVLPTPPTPLIGRVSDLAHLAALFARPDARLITLTGAAGSGKTRLALAVAAAQIGHIPDGVWFVDLVPIRDPQQGLLAIMRVLGVQDTAVPPPLERLIQAVRSQTLLLLLDNCEQVPDIAPLLAELLLAAPHLCILATSRAPLALRGEYVHVVLPLAVPPRRRALGNSDSAMVSESLDQAALTQYDAVALFLERAAAADDCFVVTDANLPAIAEICRRLDGLPLAIELAAARVRHFAPETLLTRLEHDGGLGMLTHGPRDLPERQQTLRATIAWSVGLLSPAEQALLARLSVFAGSFDLTTMAAVTGATDLAHTDVVIEQLEALLDLNLVQRVADVGSVSRFALLETVRAYAWEQVQKRGETEWLQTQYAEQMLQRAEHASRQLRSAEQPAGLQGLDLEYDNMRAALHWALAEPEQTETLPDRQARECIGLRIAGELWYYWALRGAFTEARSWASTPALRCADHEPFLRQQLLIGVGLIAVMLHMRRRAQVFAQAVHAIAPVVEDADLRALLSLLDAYVADEDPESMWEQCLAVQQHASIWVHAFVLVYVTHLRDERWKQSPEAVACRAEGLRLAQQVGGANLIARVSFEEAHQLIACGKLAEADCLLNQARHSWELVDHKPGQLDILWAESNLALAAGAIEQARQLLVERHQLAQAIGEKHTEAWTLVTLARTLLLGESDYPEAIRLLQASLMLWNEAGEPPPVNPFDWLARIAIEQGHFTDAEAYCVQAENQAHFFHDGVGLVRVRSIEGLIAEAQGDLAAAEARYRAAIAMAEEIQDQTGWAINQAWLGRVFARHGQLLESRACFEASLEVWHRQHEAWISGFALIGLAELDALDHPRTAWQPTLPIIRIYQQARARERIAAVVERIAQTQLRLGEAQCAVRW